jgi:hypothetical protein
MTTPIPLTGTITCTPPLTPEQWTRTLTDGMGLGFGKPFGDETSGAYQRFAPVVADGRITALTPITTVTATLTDWTGDLYSFLADLQDFGYQEYGKPASQDHFDGQLHGRDQSGQRYAIVTDAGITVRATTIADPSKLGAAMVRAAQLYFEAKDAEIGEEVCGYHEDLLAETFAATTTLWRHRHLLADEYLYFVDKCYRPGRVDDVVHYGHLSDALAAQHYTYVEPAQAIAAVAGALAAMLGVEDAYHLALRDLAARHGQHHIDPRSPKRQALLISF